MQSPSGVGRALRWARRRAGLTQRELAERTGVSQPTIARIETGRTTPRVDTLDRLLRATGMMLEVVPLQGVGIDRTQIREMLDLTPVQRLLAAADAGRGLGALEAARRTSQPSPGGARR